MDIFVNLKARFALTAVASVLVASTAFAQSTAAQFASTAAAGATAPTPVHAAPQSHSGLRTAAGPVDPAVVARIMALEKAWDKYDADKAAGNTAAVAVDESTIFAAYAQFHEERKAIRNAHAAAASSVSATTASNVPK